VGTSLEDTIKFSMTDLDVALKYCALPVWDPSQVGPSDGDGGVGRRASGDVPDAWAKYAAAWPEIAKAKGPLTDDGQFHMSGVYRVIVAYAKKR
jgi:hypothetical protein